jgi:hypothetical protein
VLHLQFPEELEDEQWAKAWARTKWLLKNNFVDNIKWDEVSSPPNPAEETEEDNDATIQD